MPYFDRYCSPYFQGVDYDVIRYAMPGGATSSSQEGAVKQGYIQLLPYMLDFLAYTRQIVRYHDVTPGSQTTWNTAFLAVTGAYKRGGMPAVQQLLSVLKTVTETPEKIFPRKSNRSVWISTAIVTKPSRSSSWANSEGFPLGFPSRLGLSECLRR